jgi:hypothetical protein
MNCIDLLRINGPMEAADIARELRMRPEYAYAELVREEARGTVEVRVMYPGRKHEHRLWALRPAVPDNELPAPLRGGNLEVF